MLNGIYDMQVLYPRVEEAISEKMQNVKKAFNDIGGWASRLMIYL